MGGLDGIIFTAGVGENSPEIREMCCEGLKELGIEIDLEKNKISERGERDISTPNSSVRILVIPTNEELRIAQETKKVIEKANA